MSGQLDKIADEIKKKHNQGMQTDALTRAGDARR
jgi:hypothetical protein